MLVVRRQAAASWHHNECSGTETSMKTLREIWIGAALLLTAGSAALGAGVKEEKPKFENESGWVWHMEPQPAGWHSMSGEGLSMRLDELNDGKLLLTLAHAVDANQEVVQFRPVAFNAGRQRFIFKFDSGGSSENASLDAYVFDLKGLPRDQIEFIGIEKLTKDNLRDAVAPAALRKLREAGVSALAFPQIGERYDFDLTTIEGKKISSRALRGKVVLLDFWARWCGPCMAKMPKLKEAYQRLKKDGFEVVGLNHDYGAETAKRVIDEQKLPWPNVLAPVDKDQRELWLSATGTTSLPRLLLMDRGGVLRADVSPHDVVAEIEKLVGTP
jgi:thiol-disulfide isomerase/thioredoxin